MNKKYANHLLNTGGTNESAVYHSRRSSATEVAEIMGISRSKSYQIIRELNKELKSMGYHTIAGKCPIQFFKQKFYGLEIGGESA